MNELEVLQIRDEVLQVMYWMRAEGLAESPSAAELARFLVVPAGTLSAFLARFVADGYLTLGDDRYQLTTIGEEAGKRTFAEEFADLTRPTHGECDEDCWCHEDPEEAARCLEDHAGQAH